jgi:hypothetical protein
MPSKLLIAAPEAAYEVCYTTPFGIHIEGEIRINGREVMAWCDFRSVFPAFVNMISDIGALLIASGGLLQERHVVALVGFLLAIPVAHAVADG